MQITKSIQAHNVDDRGSITHLLPEGENIRSILLITSRGGSVRSNHYHKKDTHYCYILSGKAEWYEKLVEGGDLEKEILGPGDMVYTPAMTIHAVRFLEDTTLLAFATQPRNQGAYEEDTVKVKLIE